jgi:hypothetical protein
LKNDLPTFKCPLCQSALKGEDYYQAIEDLKKKVSETYNEESKKAKQEFAQKLEDLNKARQKELDAIKTTLESRYQTLQKEKDEFSKKQFEELKKFYEEQSQETTNGFKRLEEQLRAQCKKEIDDKEKQLADLKEEQARAESIGFDRGKANAEFEVNKLKQDIQKQELQIDRFRRDADDLRKKLEQKQSELSGEIGEIDLLLHLTEAFPNDSFMRQKRGQSMGDIIHKIKTKSNFSIEMPIVYDNKQAESVTAKDIEKAKKYKEIHATDYIIIVSRNLPKKDIKNGLFGEKEGILLCHPSIVSEVVRQIRRAIIEINKQSGSKKDRERKESRLYDYITSSDFSSTFEKLNEIYQKYADLQDHEEKAHEGLWKQRRKLQSEIYEVYSDVSTGVDCILQETLPMQELSVNTSEERATTDHITEPIIAKKKKKKPLHAE